MSFNNYLQIHIGERRTIERLYEQGDTPAKIARNIFRSRSTVMREIRRNGFEGRDGKWYYQANIAQLNYERRQKKICRRKKQSHGGAARVTPAYYIRRVCERSLQVNSSQKKRNGLDENAWLRSYDENFWYLTGCGIAWREYYNSKLRMRDYWWEEKTRRERFLCREEHNKNRRYRIDLQVFRLPPLSPYLKKKRGKQNYDYQRNKNWLRPIRTASFIVPFPHITEVPGFSNLSLSTAKQEVKTSNHQYPVVFQQTEGKTMFELQQMHRILKILSFFYRGSPRFFLNNR